MKGILFVAGGLVVLVVVVAGVGLLLPRNHKASRTLRVKRSPVEVWPAVMQATQASSTPVDVLESVPPRRLVSRVTAAEKNFGGTWTIEIAPAPPGSTVTITEDGWVANPIFRFVSRFVMGHHATLDGVLKQVAHALDEEPVLSGE
jgi:hypothetical protein